MFFKKKYPHAGACMALHVLVALLLLVGSVLAVVSVYYTHVSAQGTLIFGGTPQSLSLIAFALTVTFFTKSCINCMTPCDVCKVK